MPKVPGTIEDGLGLFLRQEREARGIPLGDVARQTRVRHFYLEMIEAGEFRRLPSVPIGRGFVRAYAGAIGVDSDAAARQFDREFGKVQDQEKQVEAEKIAFSQIAHRKISHRVWVPIVAVAALILVSGVVFWALQGKTERYVPVLSFAERVKAAAGPMLEQMPQLLNPAKTGPAPGEARGNRSALPPGRESRPAAVHREPASAPGDESRAPRQAEGDARSVRVAKPGGGDGPSGSPPESRAAAGAPARPSGGEGPASPQLPPSSSADSRPLGDGGRLALNIRALEDTWVRIVVDKMEIQEFLLTAGNERNWKGSERFILTVGNVSGTQVSLNGARIPLPQSASNVVRDFVITEKLLN